MIHLDPFRFAPDEPPDLPTNEEVEELARLVESRIAHWFQGDAEQFLPGPLPFDDEKIVAILRRKLR